MNESDYLSFGYTVDSDGDVIVSIGYREGGYTIPLFVIQKEDIEKVLARLKTLVKSIEDATLTLNV